MKFSPELWSLRGYLCFSRCMHMEATLSNYCLLVFLLVFFFQDQHINLEKENGGVDQSLFVWKGMGVNFLKIHYICE